jgi:hypothetical protein
VSGSQGYLVARRGAVGARREERGSAACERSFSPVGAEMGAHPRTDEARVRTITERSIAACGGRNLPLLGKPTPRIDGKLAVPSWREWRTCDHAPRCLVRSSAAFLRCWHRCACFSGRPYPQHQCSESVLFMLFSICSSCSSCSSLHALLRHLLTSNLLFSYTRCTNETSPRSEPFFDDAHFRHNSPIAGRS